jgi:hypothetical protein
LGEILHTFDRNRQAKWSFPSVHAKTFTFDDDAALLNGSGAKAWHSHIKDFVYTVAESADA